MAISGKLNLLRDTQVVCLCQSNVSVLIFKFILKEFLLTKKNYNRYTLSTDKLGVKTYESENI